MLTPSDSTRPSLPVCEYLNELCVKYMVIDHLANHTLDEIAALINIEQHALLNTVLVQDEAHLQMFIWVLSTI